MVGRRRQHGPTVQSPCAGVGRGRALYGVVVVAVAVVVGLVLVLVLALDVGCVLMRPSGCGGVQSASGEVAVKSAVVMVPAVVDGGGTVVVVAAVVAVVVVVVVVVVVIHSHYTRILLHSLQQRLRDASLVVEPVKAQDWPHYCCWHP